MILVTGATGCIGSNLTRALVEAGERVAIMRRHDDHLTALLDVADQVEHRIADVRDPAAVERAHRGVDATFNLAGSTVPANHLARAMYEVNVVGVANVMRAARRRGSRVVHTSSVSAVGFPAAGKADEQFEFNAHGHAYAVTKRLGERIVLRSAQEGLDAVVVNPAATLAGGGDLRNGWAVMVVGLRAGRLRAYPGGGLSVATRRDVVDGHLAALARGTAGERYIISSADVTYRSLLELVAAVVGRAPPRLRLPDVAVRAAAACAAAVAPLIRDPLRRPLLTPENVPLLTGHMYYDGAKARRELGISRTPLRPAVDELASWCDTREATP